MWPLCWTIGTLYDIFPVCDHIELFRHSFILLSDMPILCLHLLQVIIIAVLSLDYSFVPLLLRLAVPEVVQKVMFEISVS